MGERSEDFLRKLLLQKQKLLLELAHEQQLTWQDALTEAFKSLEEANGGPRGDGDGLMGDTLALIEPTSKPSMVDLLDCNPKAVSLGEDLPDDVAAMTMTIESTSPVCPRAVEIVQKGEVQSSEGAEMKEMKTKRTSKFSKVATVGALLAKPHKQQLPWKEMIQNYIDYIAGFLVLINSFALMLQLELEGRQVALNIGMASGAGFENILPVFQTVDSVFVFIFLAELLLRIVVERTEFLKDVANWLDTILVISGLVDIFVSLNANAEDSTTLRFVTALKAFRAIRMVRSFRFFRGLRGLVKACQCCLPSLCWSMVLLAVFMCMGGLIMGNLLQDYIKNEANSLEDRQWIWQRYGTCYRATYTLYEMTFAGNWPVNARPVMEKVSQGFVIFYLLYITIIVFAVIRVISAIFLKDTLDEAHNDAQQLVLDRLKKKADYVQRLEGLFRTIDNSGQGMITEERLQEILANPRVKAYFQTLEIDVHEGHALFHLLDNGDGEVTLEEFIDGLMRCKGPARAIDTVALQSDVRQLDAKISKLLRHLKEAGVVRSKSRGSGLDPRTQAQNMKAFWMDAPSEAPAPKDNIFARIISK